MTVEERARELLGQTPNEKMRVIKILRTEYCLELSEAKQIVDEISVGGIIFSNLSSERVNKEDSRKESVIVNTTNHESSKCETKINYNEGTNLLNDYKAIRKTLSKLLSEQEQLERYGKRIQKLQDEEKKIQESHGVVGKIFTGIGFLVIFIGFLGGLIVIGIIIGVLVMTIGDSIDKYIERAKEFRENNIMPIMTKATECKTKIDEIWTRNEMILYEQMIPDEYKQISTIDYFIRALETGRAENQKELFNLYEEESHRRRVELVQNELLDTQKKQLQVSKDQMENLRNIQKNQKHISRQVKYGNTISTLDFLFKK